jgi:hypothetical protein
MIDPSSGLVVSDIVSIFRPNRIILAIPFSDTVLESPGGELVYNFPKGAEQYYDEALYGSGGLYADQTWPM